MKLSQELKARMTKKVLDDTFAEARQGLDQQFKALGDDIYNAAEEIIRIDELPVEWFALRSTLSCSFGGLRDYVPMSVERPTPWYMHEKRVSFPEDHEFSARFRAYHDAVAALRLREREVREELRGVLAGVSTDKQLLAIWPEASKWLPAMSAPVPAIQSVDRLKRLLGE